MDFVGRKEAPWYNTFDAIKDECSSGYLSWSLRSGRQAQNPYMSQQQSSELDVGSTVMSMSEKLLHLCWWPAQDQQLHTGNFVASEVAKKIRQATDGLVMECLDKNPAAFVAMCPKLFQEVADVSERCCTD